jgi:hypothetical protein
MLYRRGLHHAPDAEGGGGVTNGTDRTAKARPVKLNAFMGC